MNILDVIVKANTAIVGGLFVAALVVLPFSETLEARGDNKSTKGTPMVAGAYTEVTKAPIQASPTATPSPTPVPISNPILIEIPKLGINAPVAQVGLTATNLMEIPTDFFTVGWYNKSNKPGEAGASILNGHYDTSAGTPAIFNKIEDLAEGDEITITTETQQKAVFYVESVVTHPLEDFPADVVYGPFDGKGLKLITCDGVWDPIKKLYTNRLIVTARMQ